MQARGLGGGARIGARRRRARDAARDERGVVSVLVVALFLPLFLVFGAFVIDIGHAYVIKRHLQNSVDAAALAGAQGLPDETIARTAANTYSANPGSNNARPAVPANTAVVTFPVAGQKIKVDQSATVPVFFADAFGLGGITVNATATASAVPDPGEKTVIYANQADDCGKGVKINGNNVTVTGGVRSNGQLDINGGNIKVPLASGYGPKNCTPTVGGSGTVPASPSAVTKDLSAVPWPVYYSFPGDGDGTLGAPITAFPANYCTYTANKFDIKNSDVIDPGVYCASEEFKVSGNDHPPAQITVLAPIIQISGNGNKFTPFDTARDLLFFVTQTQGANTNTPPCGGDTSKLEINGGGLTLNGLLFNPCGDGVSVNATNASFLTGFLIGKTVSVNGDNFTLLGTGEPLVPGARKVALVD